MYMGKYKFKYWCSDAVSGIVFPPDREKVCEELYQHMEDHYQDLLDQGMDKEEAVRETVQAMGDPWAVAKDLAAVHRPFWGYFLRATRIILVLLLIITVIPFGKYIWNEPYRENTVWGFDIRDSEAFAEKGHTFLRRLEPDATVRSDGYTFTVTDAVEWLYRYAPGDGTEKITEVLSLRMTEFHPLPWAEHREVGQWFWAEDSLGNIYGCTKENNAYSEENYLCAYGDQSGPLTYTYKLWINDFDVENTEWITIHYDRDGRDLTWHIDLTGGDGA
ncbi:MAG: hypothetical protein IJ375_02205 [Oscillospiraceae bacterium]|nr:hypothetical protein [Oscillospiraceae bacterium]